MRVDQWKGAGSILAETDEEWHYRVPLKGFKAAWRFKSYNP